MFKLNRWSHGERYVSVIGKTETQSSIPQSCYCRSLVMTCRLLAASSSLVAGLNDKGDTLSASYYRTLSPLNTAEVAHSFSTKGNTITAGAQHQLDQLTTVKASVNNFGKATALLQHERSPNSLFSISRN
ncbi:hypothetical protein HAX54_017050 [Datura stramonium]|uniref:Uncharacterized protein n=1 Tax=Datura stramonium TaxID=4076 RepID=A0ABS8UMU7_DATST|nr:hypothetical protein [Datura stramonium]